MLCNLLRCTSGHAAEFKAQLIFHNRLKGIGQFWNTMLISGFTFLLPLYTTFPSVCSPVLQ